MTTLQGLIDKCHELGVTIRRDGETIRLRGAPDAVKQATVLLQPHKDELLRMLKAAHPDVWGPYSPYCCGVPADAVAELHRLLGEYAKRFRLAEDATARIVEAARKQSLASVPASVKAFRRALRKQTPAKE